MGRVVRLGITAALLLILALVSCSGDAQDSVVVYTSLDQPFSEPILRDFEASTGIKVQAVYDVEAAKTTGLVSRLVAERSRPRADLFWSSEFAQTIHLKDQGLLEGYDSPSAAGIPAAYRDPEKQWTGFGVRARVILVNTNLVPPERYPKSILDLLDPSWGRGEVAIANPLFGTTATHAAALFAEWGDESAQQFFRGLQQRGVQVVDGNSVVRDMVVRGEIKVGLTDTDDAHEAVAKGAPVKMIFPDQEGDAALGTLTIPNTVAMVKGAPHQAAGRRLMDYLLSPQIEERLARSGSLQIPVRPGLKVPPEVPDPSKLRAMKVSLEAVAHKLSVSSAWLKENFLK